jgi:dTDP-4-amino-4,6-dideoxygalactose transaminase
MSTSRRTAIPGEAAHASWLTVTSPLLPELEPFLEGIRGIFDRRWLTNQGMHARDLERALTDRFAGWPTALVTNATVGLDLALRAAFQEPGEILTTGYSFPATWNVVILNGKLTPRFVDIEEGGFNIDADALEAHITPQTRGILAVHAYGFPCDVDRLDTIAAKHGLKVIYDAAHTFDIQWRGAPLAAHGDLSVMSFHATKVFSTLEGGAILCRNEELYRRVCLLRNFGIQGEDLLADVGVNGKMDEVRALFGLLTLKVVADATAIRAEIARRYVDALRDEPALSLPLRQMYAAEFVHNFSYFPVLIRDGGPASAASVKEALRQQGIHARRYFHPCVATAPIFAPLYEPGSLPRTAAASSQVLCLPIHHNMASDDVDLVVESLLKAVRP